MKRKRELYPGFQIGTSLLLVILTTLCLMVFAALSLSSAMRDYAYSEKIAEKTACFYKADSEANELLAKLISSGTVGTHTYSVPINAERNLSVTAEITEDSYRILEWKEISSKTWEGNSKLPVLGSE